MLNIPLPIYVSFFFFLACLILLEMHQRYQRRQRALPQLATYLETHGQSEPACNACGSPDTHEFGLGHAEDTTRIVSCLKCKSLLYQYQRAEPDDDEDVEEDERITACSSLLK